MKLSTRKLNARLPLAWMKPQLSDDNSLWRLEHVQHVCSRFFRCRGQELFRTHSMVEISNTQLNDGLAQVCNKPKNNVFGEGGQNHRELPCIHCLR